MLAEDGSGKGAGLVSAIAQRINSRNVGKTNGHHNSEKAMNGHGKKKNGHENHTNGFHNGITNGTNGFTKHL
jgi:hypothetical protein